MYTNFQESSYFKKVNEPIHISTVLTIHTGSFVLRIKFVTDEAVTHGKTADCLVLHQKHFKYTPLN